MDEFDDFFDTPRQNVAEKNSSKSSHNAHRESTTNENSRCNKDFVKSAGKPPTHPNSRPISAANRRTLSERSSPIALVENFTDDTQAHGSRRIIEAKVPCESVKQDNEDGSYSDDSFVDDDDGSFVDECSGRRSPRPAPRTVNSDQSKEISVTGFHPRPHVTENVAQDLSDCSGSFTDDSDDDVIDVSPLNTPHCPSIPTASSSVTKDISQSSNNEPIRLLQADRDSLDLDSLLQTVLHMEKQGRSQSRQTQMAVPSSGSRRNYSFTNERIQAIDKENHRLMRRIMKHANDTKKAKAKVKKFPSSGVRTKRLSSAAVNRAKQQKEIEAENLMLLKRLQQTRPTKELRRDVQAGSQYAGRGNSARHARGLGQRPGSGMRSRPTSAYTAVQHYPCTSRPATAFPSRPDDDDILTWQHDDF